MTFQEQRQLLVTLTAEIPEVSEERTVLLRQLAADLQHRYDVPREQAIAQNPMVKRAIEIGYALANHDRKNRPAPYMWGANGMAEAA